MQHLLIVSGPEIPQTNQQNTPSVGNSSDNARKGISLAGRNPKLRVGILRALSRRPLLYGWLLELRISLHRITAISELEIYRRGLCAGPVFQKDETGNLQGCKQTLACIQDTQQLARSCSHGLLDCQLFVDGWKKGAEWGLSNSRSPGKTSL
jgi:hypothetical protein